MQTQNKFKNKSRPAGIKCDLRIGGRARVWTPPLGDRELGKCFKQVAGVGNMTLGFGIVPGQHHAERREGL